MNKYIYIGMLLFVCKLQQAADMTNFPTSANWMSNGNYRKMAAYKQEIVDFLNDTQQSFVDSGASVTQMIDFWKEEIERLYDKVGDFTKDLSTKEEINELLNFTHQRLEEATKAMIEFVSLLSKPNDEILAHFENSTSRKYYEDEVEREVRKNLEQIIEHKKALQARLKDIQLVALKEGVIDFFTNFFNEINDFLPYESLDESIELWQRSIKAFARRIVGYVKTLPIQEEREELLSFVQQRLDDATKIMIDLIHEFNQSNDDTLVQRFSNSYQKQRYKNELQQKREKNIKKILESKEILQAELEQLQLTSLPEENASSSEAGGGASADNQFV